ncbi:MAG: hypothetical protein P1U89_27785 [Verrucomicrobiales bacterium]|nr:hypothetical protein [Verrucomicrobiales bacterium]
MNRRHALSILPAVGAGCCLSHTHGQNFSENRIQTIYSNDTTHILSCQRLEQRRAQKITDERLKKSITEAAGVDAHFLQPGLGWLPWWKSKIYSAEEHYQWLRENYQVKGTDKFGEYLLEGGDMLSTLVTTCKELKIAPFLSFRLNDAHHTRDLAKALQQGKPTPQMTRHFWENYHDFRIGPDVNNWDESAFDWAIPEVRDYKFSLIEEACENYDIAGLELDFLRHWIRFGDSTDLSQRRQITTEFVAKIRKMLDRTAEARGLPRRWLCVRVPANHKVRPDQGIDLAEMVHAGVDMVNLSYSYFTWQDNAVTEARKEIGEKPSLYVEMTHCTMTGKATNGSGTQPYLRTTDEQFFTTARLAYQQGATGVSLFNFPYYRYHVTEAIGPFHEPPFSILPKLKDREFLSRQSASYFLSSGRRDRILGERVLPVIVDRKHPQQFSIGLLNTPPPGGKNGILRIRSDEPIYDRDLQVKSADQLLKPTDFIEMPLPHRYTGTWLGTKEDTLCYTVPEELLTDGGTFPLEVSLPKGIRVRITYIELVVPT